ncbi:MAG: nuclear transport factor 2 family protein [Saprospiraceae bacterium]|nr:nuclear transport factor 2 family protein [Saprospiraceae bacterium]
MKKATKNLFSLTILFLLMISSATAGAETLDIRGVWKMVESSWEKEDPTLVGREVIKFITEDHWIVVSHRPSEKAFLGGGGGTYEWVGDLYQESVEVLSWDPSSVGTVQIYSIDLNGEFMIQQGKLQTQETNHELWERWQKIGELYDEDFRELYGTWQLTEAHYGNEQLDAEKVASSYGKVLKVITPDYFVGTFFGHKGEGFSMTYGKCVLQDARYRETILAWSGEDNLVGYSPTFFMSLRNDGKLHQHGYLNHGSFEDYLLDEIFIRAEERREGGVFDRKAIMAAIRAESKAFSDQDMDRFQNCFTEDVSYATYNPDIGAIDSEGRDELMKRTRAHISANPEKWDISGLLRSDIRMKISKDLAWTSYLQEDTLTGTRTRELRILEKVDGQWKIAALSAIPLK